MAQEQRVESPAERVHRLAQAVLDSDDSGEILDLSHQLREAVGVLAEEMKAKWQEAQQEIVRLRTELADCTRDYQEVNATCEQATDLLLEVDRGEEMVPLDLLDRIHNFLESA